MDDAIKSVLARAFNLDPGGITPELGPDKVPAWDSAAHMNLVMALETEFNIQFEDEEVGELVSFEAIKEAVARRRQ